MRAVVQRVTRAKVTVEGEVTGEIGSGLLVYLGAGKGDTEADRAYVLGKVLNLRIFESDGKMDKSVTDLAGALLVVSQFTLYGDVKKGRLPSFEAAMPSEEAKLAYDAFVLDARKTGLTVATGRFRAHMSVESVNDGPVTIWIDSAKSA